MSHHIVETKELFYAYPDGTVGLNGISFRITHGESVALIGENGAGKSTLLMNLNGYLPASKGQIRVGDFPVLPKHLGSIRRCVGMVFQNSDDQLFMPTVFDDVAFGPMNLGLEQAEVEAKVMTALKTVGAEHLKDRPPYRLSQGEKKAVAIATVLAMSPDILIMDEPTSSLDPFSRRRLISLLKTFQHTKIIATHDLDMAMELCKRTIVMHQGKVVADGLTADILQDDKILSQSRLERPLSMQKCPVCLAAKNRISAV